MKLKGSRSRGEVVKGREVRQEHGSDTQEALTGCCTIIIVINVHNFYTDLVFVFWVLGWEMSVALGGLVGEVGWGCWVLGVGCWVLGVGWVGCWVGWLGGWRMVSDF